MKTISIKLSVQRGRILVMIDSLFAQEDVDTDAFTNYIKSYESIHIDNRFYCTDTSPKVFL